MTAGFGWQPDYNIWLMEFPPQDGSTPFRVTSNGGVFPLWSADGTELFFRRPQGASEVLGAQLLTIGVGSGEWPG